MGSFSPAAGVPLLIPAAAVMPGQPFHHPLVGDLTLDYDALEIPADPGQTIVAYSAPVGSPAQEALDQLANWTTTPDNATAITSDQPG